MCLPYFSYHKGTVVLGAELEPTLSWGKKHMKGGDKSCPSAEPALGLPKGTHCWMNSFSVDG